MEHDQFIGQVQHRARLASRGEAERATRATLETLEERLTAGAAEILAAELPMEIGEHLSRTASGPDSTGQQFTLDEFFDRVAEREGIDLPTAAYHARVVLEVVDKATVGGVIAKVREQLPDEFDPLFEAGSTGRLRADR